MKKDTGDISPMTRAELRRLFLEVGRKKVPGFRQKELSGTLSLNSYQNEAMMKLADDCGISPPVAAVLLAKTSAPKHLQKYIGIVSVDYTKEMKLIEQARELRKGDLYG